MEDLNRKIKFPDGFLWGTSMSGYQAEGNNIHSDYYHLELEDMKNPSEKRRFLEPSGMSANHFNLFEEDFRLMKDLGLKAHRTTFEWARLFPEKGKFDTLAGDHYSRVIDSMLQNGLRPFICLNHFTLPYWLYNEGGYENKDFLSYFKEFVEKLLSLIGDRVHDWITLNEPNLIPFGGYLVKGMPPFKTNIASFIKVYRQVLKMHAESNALIKAYSASNQVGTAHAQLLTFPYRKHNISDNFFSWLVDRLSNEVVFEFVKSGRFISPVGFGEKYNSGRHEIDFWGINYYRRTFLKGPKPIEALPGERTCDLGGGSFPEGIYQSIVRAKKKLDLPVYIMENGIGTSDDNWRIEYIRDHLSEVARAINDGYPVEGYFYWSFLDNFEWLLGYKAKFGLVEFAKNTFERKLKNSAQFLKEVISTNGLMEKEMGN